MPADVDLLAGGSSADREVALSGPVKALLEAQGYDVKGEITGCDLVGVRGDDPPVIVELKLRFSLALVHQGIDRLALTDAVYLAVGAWPSHPAEVRRLCRRLGLGLIVVTAGRADVVEDPLPYRPRRDVRRAGRLLREHRRRVGDPMAGGSTRVPVMTAYRQQALRCARLLEMGAMTLREMRAVADVPDAGAIARDDVYGWFERVGRGTYALTPKGREAVAADRLLDAVPDAGASTGSATSSGGGGLPGEAGLPPASGSPAASRRR